MNTETLLSIPASPAASAASRTADSIAPSLVLELTVRNHPGTMSHITGLFARRAFNLEAIMCVPIADGQTSRVRLLVRNDARLAQVEQQLRKLYDVLEVRERVDLDPDYFAKLGDA